MPQSCGIKRREEYFEIKRFLFSSGCFGIELPWRRVTSFQGHGAHPAMEPAPSTAPAGVTLF